MHDANPMVDEHLSEIQTQLRPGKRYQNNNKTTTKQQQDKDKVEDKVKEEVINKISTNVDIEQSSY